MAAGRAWPEPVEGICQILPNSTWRTPTCARTRSGACLPGYAKSARLDRASKLCTDRSPIRFHDLHHWLSGKDKFMSAVINA